MSKLKKVLITGANGQLGFDATKILSSKGYHVLPFGKEDLDVTNHHQVKTVITNENPDIIIHAAAYTAVDAAETNEDQAFAVNAYGTRNVAVSAQSIGAKLVYISTDYVFNGQATQPMDEFHPTDPINAYGKSKLAGEQFVRDLHNQFFIVRTSWLYGHHGNNFVKTMLKLAKENKQLSIVNDQIGCPTYTVDLVNFLFKLVGTEKYGIYHASNFGYCSWFEFATAIFEEANIDIELIPVTTNEFTRSAKRPFYSVFDHMAMRVNRFDEIRVWRWGLREFLKASVG